MREVHIVYACLDMATPALDVTLSTRLREARRGIGFSQQAVADRLEVSRRAVSEWETGNRRPHSHLPELAVLYGVSTSWLLSGVEEASVEVRELRGQVETLTATVGELYEHVIRQGQKTASALAAVLDLLGLDAVDRPAAAVEPARSARRRTTAPPPHRDAAPASEHAARSRRGAKEQPQRGAS